MNERIKELAVETGWSEDIRYAPRAKEIEKFAELIIKECCSISDDAERADVPVLASKFIKAHFGVEE